MKSFVVRKDLEVVRRGWEEIPEGSLPDGDVTIRVSWSSLNYKDALAAQGHPGIVRRFPHVPGIDAAGVVEASTDPAFHSGDEVLVTGYELGVERWGGWSEQIRVPAAWVIPRPAGLTLHEAMIYGTAGFTACQCVEALQEQGVTRTDGPILVTGATGGVGVLSCRLLQHLGYRVIAVTGKPAQSDWLLQHGATEVISREKFVDLSDRPLLSARWAGGIDTVGGAMLSTLIRSTNYRGTVAACGMAGGTDLPLTVHPLILRGVTIRGIDSARCPADRRLSIWEKLSGAWKLPALESFARTITGEELESAVQSLLAGTNRGRVVLRI